jgi:hypothetical protein
MGPSHIIYMAVLFVDGPILLYIYVSVIHKWAHPTIYPMSLCSGGNRSDARLGRWSLSHTPGPTREYMGVVTSAAEGKRVNTSNTWGPDLDQPPQLGRTPATPTRGLHRGRVRRRPVTVMSMQPSPHPGATTTTGCDPSPRRSVLHAFRLCVFILFSF